MRLSRSLTHLRSVAEEHSAVREVDKIAHLRHRCQTVFCNSLMPGAASNTQTRLHFPHPASGWVPHHSAVCHRLLPDAVVGAGCDVDQVRCPRGRRHCTGAWQPAAASDQHLNHDRANIQLMCWAHQLAAQSSEEAVR
jgi:hypothetical protein